MLKKNMHKVDRLIRAIVGIVLVYLGFFENGWTSNSVLPLIIGSIGAANVIFALSGFCPVYVLANLNFANASDKD